VEERSSKKRERRKSKCPKTEYCNLEKLLGETSFQGVASLDGRVKLAKPRHSSREKNYNTGKSTRLEIGSGKKYETKENISAVLERDTPQGLVH